MLNKSEQAEEKIDEVPEQDWKWYRAIRELMQHEDNMASTRLAWTGTFQTLLFAALAFSWDQEPWLVTFVLCFLGFIISFVSLWSLLESSTATDRLYDIWRDYIGTQMSSKTPPVWAWESISEEPRDYHWLTRFINGLRRPSCRYPRRGWFRAPWHWIPVFLLLGWLIISVVHIGRFDVVSPWSALVRKPLDEKWQVRKPLEEQWQFLVQSKLEQALMQKDKSSNEAKRSITGLALIHGDYRNGEAVFGRVCADCHDKESMKDKTIPNRDMLRKDDREKIVSGILYPNQKRVTRQGKPCMMPGFTTLLTPRDFVDVVEYLRQKN
jgi:mono/diheme cytochrome c family protein